MTRESPILARPRRCPAGAPCRGPEGFTILEIQISLVVLVTGLMSMAWLVSTQSKQMTRAEAWCRDHPTYYVLNQPNRWLRKLDASAELKTEPGAEPWQPAVSGPQENELRVTSCEVNLDTQTVTIRVELPPTDP